MKNDKERCVSTFAATLYTVHGTIKRKHGALPHGGWKLMSSSWRKAAASASALHGLPGEQGGGKRKRGMGEKEGEKGREERRAVCAKVRDQSELWVRMSWAVRARAMVCGEKVRV